MRYDGVVALEGCDLEITAGERVAVIGPSGAGKSTLIALLNGMVAPTDGTVTALGCDLARAPARTARKVRRQIGTIYQHFDLVEELRVVHNVNAGRLGAWPFWRAALSLVRPSGVGEVRGALERVGIPEKLDARTSTLSGGQKQRVAVAKVLVQQPRAILADEPIASLDPRLGGEVIDLLTEISADLGTTLVTSLHDVTMALGRFERVVALRAGRIEFDRPPGAVSSGDIEDLYAAVEPAS
ncbi:phosphonate ABC transporter ATP-binding protein [Actinomycetospora straminea]|uniref:phosphonate ABC transporter ATP-binding protein n=1 Tax=Actinomycetospora straminea TaxID=663607 RepID=UPI002366424B|nr:ATP-binding cassette domain-containing protein [Actinomycetospora straminea]MDD7934800.1 ATP-binding cassette domain-containing protein [Actinomycetospora straminea]